MEKSPDDEGTSIAGSLLETVLSSLYDFGEPLLDVHQKNKGKKKERSAAEGSGVEETESVVRSRRKTPSGFFRALKDEFFQDGVAQENSAAESATPPEKEQKGKATQIEVVTFRAPKKKLKREVADKEDSEEQAIPSAQEKYIELQEHTLEKARLEVHRFGITGFEKKEQRVLEQERAIMLGAKAPKKEYLNYKILQEKIKRNKAMKKEENVMEIRSDSRKRMKTKGHERKSKKTKHSILPTGQVGTFKNGTLVLRKSDIKKIKSSKGIH